MTEYDSTAKKLKRKDLNKTANLVSKLNATKLLIGAIVAAPVVLLVGLIKHFAVNVPIWDSWVLVDLFTKSHSGTLGFADFFAQHNEHRDLFPTIILYLLAQITHWNTNYELVVSLIFAVLTFMLMLKILQKTFSNKWIFASGASILSLIFFSPLQWENWLWGWELEWFINVFGVVLAVWALSSWEQKTIAKRIVVAAIASIVATYSLASGMFVWFICLPIFYYRKDLRKYISTWVGCATLTIISYYIGYTNPTYQQSKTWFIYHPVMFVKYLALYVAHPISVNFPLAPYFGLAILIVFGGLSTYLILKKRSELSGSLLPWLCFIIYGLITAVAIDISRLGYGVGQAYVSRYVTLSNFCIIGLVVMLLKTYEITNRENKLQILIRTSIIFVLLMMVLLVIINYGRGIEQMKNKHQRLTEAKQCAQLAKSKDDNCLLIMHHDRAVVWKNLEYLRSIHWGGL